MLGSCGRSVRDNEYDGIDASDTRRADGDFYRQQARRPAQKVFPWSKPKDVAARSESETTAVFFLAWNQNMIHPPDGQRVDAVQQAKRIVGTRNRSAA